MAKKGVPQRKGGGPHVGRGGCKNPKATHKGRK